MSEFSNTRIKELKDQVINLTRDCHYLISLLNSSSNEIDWENWPQGQKIKEDLERSKNFFEEYQKPQTKSKNNSQNLFTRF